MQGLVGVLVAVGLLRGNLVLAVNGTIGLATTLVPAAFHRFWEITFRPRFVVWIAAAVLLHTVGMAGPYETIWWWDHLTHTLSAALVAGVGYAVADALDEHARGITLPRDFLFVYVILFTMAAGVLWEVLEFGGRELAQGVGQQPILIQYGAQDTVLDLLFDAVGAVIVGVLGQRWTGIELPPALERRLEG